MSQFRFLDAPLQPPNPSEGVITPGVYGDANHFPRITVNSRGLITNIELVPFSGAPTTGGEQEYADLDDQQITDLDGSVITDLS